MKIIDNQPCLEYKELVPEIMSESNFKWHKGQGNIQTIGRGGNGNKVYIVIDSLPPKYRSEVERLLGCPKKAARMATIKEVFEDDRNAEIFFKEHRTSDGTGLGDELIGQLAQSASMLNTINRFEKEGLVRKYFESKAEFWAAVGAYIEKKKIKLPTSYCKMLPRLKAYNEGDGKNYASLIHGNYGNDYSEKVDDLMRGWILATYASPANPIPDLNYLLELYNQEATRRDRKTLKSISTLYRILTTPENERLWMGPRQGYLKLKNKYGYKIKTEMPTLRDSLWYGDGTKLNFFDKDGKLKASYTVYEIIDAYSEAFIGFNIANSENFESQFLAFKMAIKTSTFKPFELRYDNQGGHKKLISSNFLNKLARLSIATRPYSPTGKSIESVFGRFQSQFMARHWFFTGQNITARKASSRANMEFILSNVHNLPTIEEIAQVYIADRQMWNQAPHPKTGLPRIEMYNQSVNSGVQKVNIWDMVDLFWLTTPKPITYRSALSFTISKRCYEFEVLKDGLPDADFRRKYTNERFFVKYDPDDLSFVLLYQDSPNGLQFITRADDRLHIQRNIQEQKPGERKTIRALNDYQVDEIETAKNKIENLMTLHCTSAESFGLNSARVPGTNKKKPSIGQLLKEESMEDYHEMVAESNPATDSEDWISKI